MNSAKKLTLLFSLIFAVNSLAACNMALAGSLEQAYELSVSGDIQASEQLYNQLLEQKQIPTYEIYFSKCLAYLNRLDLTASEQEYQLALAALENNPGKGVILTEFDYKRAALLINKGESSRALVILKQYVYKAEASVRMQSDYLDAKYRLGDYTHLVVAAQKFWRNDYQTVPNYGILLVADSLFKLNRYAEAEKLYALILARDNNHLAANLSLAYCLAVRQQDRQALDFYKKCYTLRENSEEILLVEAEVLFATDKRRLANNLYDFLTTKSTAPDKVKLAKAKVLGDNGYTLGSADVLSSVSLYGRGSDYLNQKFVNNMNDELYHNALQALHQLANTASYSDLRLRYAQARRGGIETGFSTASNYKGNSFQTYRLEGDSYIGMNTYITAALDNTRLSDEVNIAKVTTSTLGLVHRFERGKIYASLANAVAGSAHTLYNAGFSYKISDFTNIGFDLGKRYIGDSKAVLNGFITENYYSVSLAHKFNTKNILFADYTGSSLTDSNRFYGYSFSYSYYPVSDKKRTHEFYAYYRRSGFSELSPYYESPDKRIAYGLGWQARWYQSNSAYWTFRLNLELGHDNLEPTDLSPGIRVQYTHPLAKRQELSLAVEYGVRTNRLNAINYFVHGYKQFEVKYNISW